MIKLDECYELKTCPFCGGENLFLISKPLPTEMSPDMCHGCIWCDDCRVNGPSWTSGSFDMLCDDASRVWNKRGKNE